MQLRYLQLTTYAAIVVYLASILADLPVTSWMAATSFGGDNIFGVIIFLAFCMHAAWYLSRTWKGLLLSILAPLFIYCSGEVLWSLMYIFAHLQAIPYPIPGSDPITVGAAFYVAFCFSMRLDKYFRQATSIMVLLWSAYFLFIMIPFLYNAAVDITWHLLWLCGFMLAAKYKNVDFATAKSGVILGKADIQISLGAKFGSHQDAKYKTR